MKQFINILIAGALAAGFISCREQYTTYSDREYVMFADSLSTNIVLEDQEYFMIFSKKCGIIFWLKKMRC